MYPVNAKACLRSGNLKPKTLVDTIWTNRLRETLDKVQDSSRQLAALLISNNFSTRDVIFVSTFVLKGLSGSNKSTLFRPMLRLRCLSSRFYDATYHYLTQIKKFYRIGPSFIFSPLQSFGRKLRRLKPDLGRRKDSNR